MFERSLDPSDVEISDETFIITRETALAHREALAKPGVNEIPTVVGADSTATPVFAEPATAAVLPFEQPGKPMSAAGGLRSLSWTARSFTEMEELLHSRSVKIRLCLSEIKSVHSDGVSRRGLASRRCTRRLGRVASLVHPCSMTGVFGCDCSRSRNIAEHGEDVARQTQ